MFKIKYFLPLTLLMLFSCSDDLLDIQPKGVVAEGVLSGNSIDKLVVGAYQALGAHFFGNDESFAGPASNWIIDVRSDDAVKGGGGITDRTDIHQLETASMDPTNFAVAQKWRNNYFGVARCNLALREIQKLADPNYPSVIRTAELRFLRGHFHFDLIRNFSNIIYLDENADPTMVGNTAQSPAEVYQLIKADFTAALADLPDEQDEIGRINRYMAAAYLAKVNMELGEYAEAITNTGIVMSANRYALLDDFRQLSELDFENGSESVFTIQYSTASIFANHDWGNLLNVTLGPGIDGGAYANGDDFYQAAQNLVNAFRVDGDGLPLFDSFNNTDVRPNFSGTIDPRLDFTVGRIGIPWKKTAVYDEAWIRSTDYLGYSNKKAVVAPDDPRVHNSFPWAASGLNFNIIRYAEVLLWRAEALIETNANLEEARQLINQVRERAQNSEYVKTLDGSQDAANYNIGLYPAAGWDQAYARQAVRFERRLELAMEGHRFFDLNRWGITANTMNDFYKSEVEHHVYLDGVTFESGKHDYLPIPQREIDLAPDLYTQNSGY